MFTESQDGTTQLYSFPFCLLLHATQGCHQWHWRGREQGSLADEEDQALQSKSMLQSLSTLSEPSVAPGRVVVMTVIWHKTKDEKQLIPLAMYSHQRGKMPHMLCRQQHAWHACSPCSSWYAHNCELVLPKLTGNGCMWQRCCIICFVFCMCAHKSQVSSVQNAPDQGLRVST